MEQKDKTCSKGVNCVVGNIPQVHSEFYRGNVCRTCVRAQATARYAANPEKYKMHAAAWKTANPERHKATGAAWNTANPGRRKAITAAWCAAHRDCADYRVACMVKGAHARERHRKQPETVFDPQLRETMADFISTQPCPSCGDTFSSATPPPGHTKNPRAPSLDAISPGQPYKDNWRIICSRCNTAKFENTQEEFDAWTLRRAEHLNECQPD